jgi:outer membrane immunogenic protein
MNRKHLLGGVAAAALLIGGAMQAQATDAPSAFEPPPGWTGFHIGVGGGVNFLLSEGSEAFADYFSDDKFAAARADLGTADWFGTVEAGFDFQRNRLVFGILANYDFGEKELDMEGAGGWYDGGDD